MNTLFEQMNTNQTFIFVDGSYFNFYRYHSLLTWWKNAFPEDQECLKDPYQNPQFLEKFKKTFATNIQNLQKNLKIDKLVDVIASMARVEEKIVGQDARLKRHEFRLDENERKIEEVGEATQTNSFIARVGTTLVATIGAGLVAYVFYIFRGE